MRERRNKYNGKPQDTPIPNVAIKQTIKTHQSLRTYTSEAIQIDRAQAEIVRSHIKPRDASFTVHAATIPTQE